MKKWNCAAWCVAALLLAAPCQAWDAHGHRLITNIALDGVAAMTGSPSWLNEPEWRRRAAYQSAEADRWRGQRTPALIHENNLDHYIDVEYLDAYGLTLRTVPPLRYEFLRQMSVVRAAHPERWPDYDASKDQFGDRMWPGFLPHSIMEHYAKLQASFRTLRLLEAVDGPGRADQIEQARSNVIFHIGMLSHFVGDAAQPLHTTQHFNGWTGPNPNGYTTSNRFHAYIDGGVLETHAITYETVRPLADFDLCVAEADPWADVLTHIERSFAHMEQLYQMEKDGSLDQAPGKALIEARLADGAEMLAAMIHAAWVTSEPDGAEVKRFSGWTPPDAP